MKIEATRPAPPEPFRPVTLTMTFETHEELQSFRATLGWLTRSECERLVHRTSHPGATANAAYHLACQVYFDLDKACGGEW